MKSSPKIKRNDPCPCGSGKKYKKCCEAADRAQLAERMLDRREDQERRAQLPMLADMASRLQVGDDPFSAEDGLFGHGPFSLTRCSFTPAAAYEVALGGRLPGYEPQPWVVARFRDLLVGQDGLPAPRVTIRSVRARSTEELLEDLSRAGGPGDAEAFVASTAPFQSAFALAESWDLDPLVASEPVGLVARELWSRLLPERPCLESLELVIQEGYDQLEQGDIEAAGRTWLGVWERLVPMVPDGFTTLEDTDAWFPGVQSLRGWYGESSMHLLNLCLNQPAFRPRALDSWRALADRLPADRAVRADLAALLWTAGERREAERMFRALIAEDPLDPGPYAMLASNLGARGAPADLKAGIELLEEALARPVRKPEAWDIERRLIGLRGVLAAVQSAG